MLWTLNEEMWCLKCLYIFEAANAPILYSNTTFNSVRAEWWNRQANPSSSIIIFAFCADSFAWRVDDAAQRNRPTDFQPKNVLAISPNMHPGHKSFEYNTRYTLVRTLHDLSTSPQTYPEAWNSVNSLNWKNISVNKAKTAKWKIEFGQLIKRPFRPNKTRQVQIDASISNRFEHSQQRTLFLKTKMNLLRNSILGNLLAAILFD